MGNLTAKTSGELASFMTPAKTNIKSLKVHFSPKQLGTGDPSPENVREIEGWDGVEVAKSSVNLLDQSYIIKASGWVLSSDNDNTMYCGVPVYKGNINKFYTKFKSGYPFIGNPFKENVQYNVSAWLKTVSGNSIQGLKFGFKYTDGTTSLGGIFSANDTWKRQTVTSKANKTVSGIYCSYNSSGEIYLCGLAVCEKEFDDINIVHSSTANDISYQWKKLPDEYQEVEYIESTGTQYIDTGIVLNNGCVITLDFLITGLSVNRVIYGWRRKNKYTDPYQAYIGANANKIRYVAIGKSSDIDSPSSLYGHAFEYGVRNKVLIDSADEQVLVNNLVTDCGEDFSNGKAFNESGSSEFHPYLFALNNAGSPFAISGDTKLYAYSVQYEDESLQTFIPCYRKSDGEIGMYDTVSQKFFTNQGTGTFLKGEDVFSDIVYGGYVDLISGELVETCALEEYTSNNTWQEGTASSQIVYQVRRKNIPTGAAFVSNLITRVTSISGSMNNVGYAGGTYLNVKMTSVATLEDFLTLLESNPLQIVYTFTTPITHQLTPTQLKSFVGQNNFWSNADYVEIEYDLIETEDIQKCRKKIILNQPHIKSVSSNIANFTTDMEAPLKECKINFLPIQEGEGDPSPDNIKNVIGWNEINIYNDQKYGGNIIWNQLYDGSGSTGTNGGITYTKLDNGTWEVKGTSNTTSGTAARRRQIQSPSWEANHVYWFSARAVGEGTQYLQMALSISGSIRATTTLYDGAFAKPTTKINQFSFRVLTQNITVDAIARPQIIDLTMLFGEEMANYIYNLEVSKSGAGKDYFFNLFPKDWYEYNAGELTTVSVVNGDPCISTSMSWANEVGTVYGGYLDLIKGEVVATYALFDAYQNRSLFTQGDGNVYIVNNHFATYGFVKPININESISTHFKAADITTESYPSFSISNTGHFALRGIPNVTDTVEHFTAYVEEQMNNNTPVQFVMPLITPVIYQLTPQQLLTFKGQNNIWSDTNGQTEVKFWIH